MNTSRLAHISISIFRHCRSVLFSVETASYFLVGRHRLSFLCARDREFRKNIKKRERLPISFLMSVFGSYLGVVNTHTHSFFPRLPSYIIRTNKKKLADEECVCVHTHTKKKKRRKDIHPIREWQQ